MRRPNFLYIGTAKAGTSWLVEAFAEHPDIFVPVAKDLDYFCHQYNLDEQWYLRHFAPADQQTAVGEISHDYFLFSETAARIHRFNPEMRLIVTLREPGSLLRSFYRYSQLHSKLADEGFRTFANHPDVYRYVNYYDNLKPFYEIFPPENIFITYFEDLKASPSAFIADIYTFLKVDATFQPKMLDRRFNTARSSRWRFLTRLAYDTAGALRRIGLASFVGTVKRNPVFTKLLYSNQTPPLDILPEDLQDFRACISTMYHDLEQMTGKPLPGSWYQAVRTH
jgi:hypothetical protein